MTSFDYYNLPKNSSDNDYKKKNSLLKKLIYYKIGIKIAKKILGSNKKQSYLNHYANHYTDNSYYYNHYYRNYPNSQICRSNSQGYQQNRQPENNSILHFLNFADGFLSFLIISIIIFSILMILLIVISGTV